MSPLATHLWISTIVLLVALIAARFLPLTARTRHALLLCGLLKLALPSVVFTAPLRAIGLDLSNLGRETPGLISIEWLGGPPPPLLALAAPPSTEWRDGLLLAWIISAVVLAAAWAVARWRLVSTALQATSAASPRERTALTAARHRLGLRSSVDVTRSTVCEAPAVIRIIRPVIVLPDGGCDGLDDAELESLLRHECAHVARRDNLLGLFESAIVAAFWFHPLVWVAQRTIATAREEACDEVAAATGETVDTYISALSKICRAVLAPRLAGVSCMASAHLKERLKHIMSYEDLRTRALSHRFVVALAATVVLAVTVGSGLRAASPAAETPYTLTFSVSPGAAPDTVDFSGMVVEQGTNVILARPALLFKRGSKARVQTSAEGRDITLDIRDEGGKVTATMRVSEKGLPLQESVYTAAVASERQRPRNRTQRYTGAPITMNLKDADLKDVLKTFGQLTGIDMRYPDKLQGKVTLDIRNMPWDQAFDLILREHDLTWEMEGNVMTIRP